MKFDPYKTQAPPLTAPDDPALDALLDQALAAGPVPASLRGRILDATTPMIVARRQPVLARIGALPLVRAAAMIAVAAGVLGILTLTDRQSITEQPTDTHMGSLAQLEWLDATTASARSRAEPIDQRITALSLRVALAASSDPWGGPESMFDDLALEADIDLLTSDMGLF